MALRAFGFFASGTGTAGADQVALVIANNEAEARTLLLLESAWNASAVNTIVHEPLLAGSSTNANDATLEPIRHDIKHPNGYIFLNNGFGS